jgi:capsular polysaccharide export protein
MMPAARRSILFLQGPSSPFWSELARAFEAAGHATHRIHCNMGDFVFWRRFVGTHYRGRIANFGAFLESYIVKRGITDILYYGDRLPYHAIANKIAQARGINAIAVENGYLRPDWITLERGGMGIFSHFPNDPAAIRAIAAAVPAPDLAVRHRYGFEAEMVWEYTYHFFALFYRPLYPFHDAGKYNNPFRELWSGLPHYFTRKPREAAASARIEQLAIGADPYFIVALQLQGDQQIQANSPYRELSTMIGEVIGSFARFAPKNARLVFKQHPHDDNLLRWSELVPARAAEAGIAARVDFLDGGDLSRLLSQAAGAVMVNSTVGLHSIRAGCPTKILGIAVYDMPGLTHQGPLDDFWQSPQRPDAELAEAFVRAIAATIQIKGSFYEKAGRERAIAEIVRRVSAGLVNEPGGFVDPPPRMAAARRLGINAADNG